MKDGLMLKCIGDLSLQYIEREAVPRYGGFLLVRRCVVGEGAKWRSYSSAASSVTSGFL
jgi:hypothetical protein